MTTALANQIAAALIRDGVCKLTREEIVAAILPAYLPDYVFGGVAHVGSSPGKISRKTVMVTASDGVYRSFSGHSIDAGIIALFTSEDGRNWERWIAYDGGRGEVKLPELDPTTIPLTFEAAGDATEIRFVAPDADRTKEIEISTDGGKTWAGKTSSADGALLAILDEGQTLLVRGRNSSYGYNNAGNKFAASAPCYVYGNIMSLVDPDDTDNAVMDINAFAYMFDGAAWLQHRDNYDLALPATTLAASCYQGMFQNCTGLTSAPALPATTLAASCYRAMFQGATHLEKVTCLATDISAENATNNWLQVVAAAGTFRKAAGVTWPTGVSGIPTGWTVEEV